MTTFTVRTTDNNRAKAYLMSEEDEEEEVIVDCDELTTDADSVKLGYNQGDFVVVSSDTRSDSPPSFKLARVDRNTIEKKEFKLKLYDSKRVCERELFGEYDCDSYEVKDEVTNEQGGSVYLKYDGFRKIKKVNRKVDDPSGMYLVYTSAVKNPNKEKKSRKTNSFFVVV